MSDTEKRPPPPSGFASEDDGEGNTTPRAGFSTGAVWWPIDLDSMADHLNPEGGVFYVAPDEGTTALLLHRGKIATQAMFLPGMAIAPTSPLLPPIADWSQCEARLIFWPDAYGLHQANQIARYLRRSGVGSVKTVNYQTIQENAHV